MKQDFNFSTYHNQFYISDKNYDIDLSDSGLWNEIEIENRLTLRDGFVGVYSESYGNIKGEIELLSNPSKINDFTDFDMVVEGDIYIRSGILTIRNCPDNDVELTLNLEPKRYRIRIYGSNFKSVKESDFANETDNDYYRIELWVDDNIGVKVLK